MLLNDIIDNEQLLLALIAIGSSIGAIISNAEWIALTKNFKDGGIFSWKVRQVRTNYLIKGKYASLANFFFTFPNIISLFLLRVVIIVSLFFLLNNLFFFGLACLILVILAIVISLRGNEGTTGADQMNTITYLVVGLCIISDSPLVWKAGIITLTALIIISYSTSGWIRILQPTWRNGDDLLVVLRQHTYGSRLVWKLGVKNKGLVKFTSLAILIFECSSAIVVFLPIEIVTLFLIVGVVFHAMNAFIMGLNTFVWSFIPLYLAYYWTAVYVNLIIWNY